METVVVANAMVPEGVDHPMVPESIELLTAQGYDVRQVPASDRVGLAAAAAEADALIVFDQRIDREILAAAGQRLRVISRYGTGLDNIDLEAATLAGIQVTHTPFANGVSVAEHILGMIIALAKNLRRVDEAVRAGHRGIRHELRGIELAGATLGIVGLGNIGRALARMALDGLQMRVIAHDAFVDTPPEDLNVEMAPELSAVLRDADFVSISVALDERTRGLIGREQLASMKPGSYLINCARAEVVDEQALIDALRSGHLAGAGIDVFSVEPAPADSPLFDLENVILTPHMASFTHSAMRRMAVQAAQNVIEVLSGRPATWPANQIAVRGG